jgi:hypothetical protein
MLFNDAMTAAGGVGIATGQCPGSIPDSAKFFSPHSAQNCSGAHPASYPMGTGDDFPGGKAAGA